MNRRMLGPCCLPMEKVAVTDGSPRRPGGVSYCASLRAVLPML
jgi:hypothetical protein